MLVGRAYVIVPFVQEIAIIKTVRTKEAIIQRYNNRECTDEDNFNRR